MHRLILLLSAVVLVGVIGCGGTEVSGPGGQAAVKSDGKVLDLVAVKDARMACNRGEARVNGGGNRRLRAAGLARNTAEMALMDFDRAALRAFLDKNKDKAVTARLVVTVRTLQNGPAKLEVAALDTASDWNEGDKSQQPADRGECCFAAAQFGVKPWTTADGKELRDLGELIYSGGGDRIKTLLNPNTVTVTDADIEKAVGIKLAGEFLDHLARDPNCRGVVLLTRSDGAKVDIGSRDRETKEPRLVLTVE